MKMTSLKNVDLHTINSLNVIYIHLNVESYLMNHTQNTRSMALIVDSIKLTHY